MKFLAILIAAALGLLGLVFVIGAGQGNALPRIAIGVVCLFAAGALIVLSRMKPATTTHVHKMDLNLSGDVSMEQIKCRQCSAQLSSDAVSYKAGAVFVNCPYCGTSYQLEEAPKW